MKYLLVSLIVAFCSFSCKVDFSDRNATILEETRKYVPDTSATITKYGRVYNYVDEMPKFENGDKDIFKFLSSIEIPDSLIHGSLKSNAIVRFVVNEDGTVANTEVLRGINHEIDKIYIEAINKMTQWQAGELNGKQVKVYLTTPVFIN